MRRFTVSFYYDGDMADDDEGIKAMMRGLVERGDYWVEEVEEGLPVDIVEE